MSVLEALKEAVVEQTKPARGNFKPLSRMVQSAGQRRAAQELVAERTRDGLDIIEFLAGVAKGTIGNPRRSFDGRTGEPTVTFDVPPSIPDRLEASKRLQYLLWGKDPVTINMDARVASVSATVSGLSADELKQLFSLSRKLNSEPADDQPRLVDGTFTVVDE